MIEGLEEMAPDKHLVAATVYMVAARCLLVVNSRPLSAISA